MEGKYTLFLGDREEVLLDVVVLDLADEGLGDDGSLISEASSLDGGSVDVCGVVGEEFGVEVGGEGSVGDVGVLAEVGPGLEVLVVDVLSGLLESFLLSRLESPHRHTQKEEGKGRGREGKGMVCKFLFLFLLLFFLLPKEKEGENERWQRWT